MIPEPLVMAVYLLYFAAEVLSFSHFLSPNLPLASYFSYPWGLPSSIPPTLEEQRPLVIMTAYLGISQRAAQGPGVPPYSREPQPRNLPTEKPQRHRPTESALVTKV